MSQRRVYLEEEAWFRVYALCRKHHAYFDIAEALEKAFIRWDEPNVKRRYRDIQADIEEGSFK